MSWNPRRFAVAVHGNATMRDARMLWLTSEALDRLASAAKHDTLDFGNAPPFPDEGLVVGFAEGMETEAGHVVSVVHVIPQSSVTGAGICADVQPHTPNAIPSPTLGEVMTGASALLGYGEQVGGGVVYVARTQREVADEHLGVVLQLSEHFEPRVVSLGGGIREACAASEWLGTHRCGDHHDHIEGLTPRERAVLRYFAHAAWVLLHEPVEREVSATVLTPTPIRTGKGRRARDVSVSVIDVRRSTATRYKSSGRVIEHDHRWTRRAGWAWRACGKGKTERRRVWIDEVICGPADKPLIRRPKVSVLR